jgi:hypothetical protein
VILPIGKVLIVHDEELDHVHSCFEITLHHCLFTGCGNGKRVSHEVSCIHSNSSTRNGPGNHCRSLVRLRLSRPSRPGYASRGAVESDLAPSGLSVRYRSTAISTGCSPHPMRLVSGRDERLFRNQVRVRNVLV